MTADYAGQAPMVGFGAGAYLISLYARGTAGVMACGAYATEPANPGSGSDGGTEGGDAGPINGGGGGGCCGAGGGRDFPGALLLGIPVVLIVRRKRS